MDQIDWKIIILLQKNARITFSQLSKKVNLTPPAVSERILKLEEKGIINGYTARINLDQLGYKVICFVNLEVAHHQEEKFVQFSRSHNEIIECYLISGKSSFLVKAGAPSVAALEDFLKELKSFGQTQSHIVLQEVFKEKIFHKLLNEAL